MGRAAAGEEVGGEPTVVPSLDRGRLVGVLACSRVWSRRPTPLRATG